MANLLCTLSTQLIPLHYPDILFHRSSTTVSLKTCPPPPPNLSTYQLITSGLIYLLTGCYGNPIAQENVQHWVRKELLFRSLVLKDTYFVRTTCYIDQMGAWYDNRTKQEVMNLLILKQLQQAVGSFGLTGLDKLLSFMIVKELQVRQLYVIWFY